MKKQKMTKVDLDDLYSSCVEKEFELLLKEAKRELLKNEHIWNAVKLNDYRNSLFPRQELMKMKPGKSEGSYDPDEFLRALLDAFEKRGHKYKKNSVSFFIADERIKLKTQFADRPNAIQFPEIFDASDVNLVKFLGKYYAINKFTDHSRGYDPVEEEMIDDIIENIRTAKKSRDASLYVASDNFNLTGTEKPINSEVLPIGGSVKFTVSDGNNNQFVQLVYALYKAEYLNNGDGEITKIVEELADFFQVDLSDGWQKNLSNSIRKTNSSYSPPIFDKLKKAYELYAKDRLEKKS